MITLTTDLDDIYVSQMKAAILSLNPAAKIVDISHDTSRFNVRRASFAILCAARIFPVNTVHVCVVDPGVGSERRGIVVEAGEVYFVGPDNGVFTLPLSIQDSYTAYSIEPERAEKMTSRAISVTFHGRDIFAPVAAALDSGEHPGSFGREIGDPVLFEIPQPRVEGGRAWGTVLFIDGFGNVITDIPGHMLELPPGSTLEVSMGGKTFPCISASTYADAEPGQLIALVGSQGTYEISLNRGKATSAIGGTEGDEIGIAMED
jgi:S-adenosylmethionine hydrolase